MHDRLLIFSDKSVHNYMSGIRFSQTKKKTAEQTHIHHSRTNLINKREINAKDAVLDHDELENDTYVDDDSLRRHEILREH